MNFAAIEHKAYGSNCYALDDKSLVIRLKTGYEVKKVELIFGDPFDKKGLYGDKEWITSSIEIKEQKKLKYQLLWQIVVKPEFKRIKYCFKLYSEEECFYYFENDFYTEEQMKLRGPLLQYFIFPWMNEIDINKTPNWVNNTIWYQIFVDRFCNGDERLNPENVKPWKYEKVSAFDYYGGDLEGIINKLPYLKELGISGIYLTPIFKGDSNHKYDTKDYEAVDPHFGDEKKLKELIKKAHEHGMKIMIDAVFNHTSYMHPMWQEVCKKGPESKYYDWYMINRWPFDLKDISTRDGKYYSFAFAAPMPKLNTCNPKVVNYLIGLLKKWVSDYEIDGIRFDVGNEVSHAFVKQVRRELKAINPDIYLCGEIWHDSNAWLLGDEYDAVMNYPFLSSVTEFWCDPALKNREFEYAMNYAASLYMEQTSCVQLNLLDSHDTERLINRCADEKAFYEQLAVLFTMNGSACIYYGTEIALQGGMDPDCRRCMPWQDIEAGKYTDKLEKMKKLIHMRSSYPSLRRGDISYYYDCGNERVLHYKKTLDGEKSVHVYINASLEDVNLDEKKAEGFLEHKILFSNEYSSGVLKAGGVLILA
ncbi:glycoside hydrolase family 13 protein [Clostridium hydrogenum]|uniref:glycoside hydrolase family 13 protein n=1 Tax=Clostridium hydrogenum TaxID=2855764 RepID=UPI001F278D30|nr:glycoside hydrolase family 13 protein [Clostridium hydrogenum]